MGDRRFITRIAEYADLRTPGCSGFLHHESGLLVAKLEVETDGGGAVEITGIAGSPDDEVAALISGENPYDFDAQRGGKLACVEASAERAIAVCDQGGKSRRVATK